VGPVTALTYVLTLGDPHRFATSRAAGAYLGLRPRQRQSGDRDPDLGIAKNGDGYLRSLLVEAGQTAARGVPELQRAYQRLKHRKHSSVAKVMIARKLAVRLYWMWKTEQPYSAARMQGSPSHPVAER
jgi:transposase